MLLFSVQTFSYPQIADAKFRCALWTFKQQLALKCENVVEFLLFSYKRLCTVTFGIPYKEVKCDLCFYDHGTFEFVLGDIWLTRYPKQKQSETEIAI